jgi:hypothetical protein
MTGRPEQDIFEELTGLCASNGYAHALALLCFRDNVVGYSEELQPEDFAHLRSPERLIRTEVTTLAGLMLKNPISLELPDPRTLQRLMDRTEELLRELHEAILAPAKTLFQEALTSAGKVRSPFGHSAFMREAIFYGADSAYSFQYRDLAVRKYQRDNAWLRSKKGFTIEDAAAVTRAVKQVQDDKFVRTTEAMRSKPPNEWTILPAFCLTPEDITTAGGIGRSVVDAVLDAFAVRSDERNDRFKALHDFNVISGAPLIRATDNSFILFSQYGLMEALYESPFYWMGCDGEYSVTARKHRGDFTEEFCRERLELVFGRSHVHRNVKIFESKSRTVGEIDTLVLFGNRALVLQAKSKRLTLEARRGNDRQIRDDFKKSVQDAYDQASRCATKLRDPALTFEDPESRVIKVPRNLTEIYPLCVVADHYPALSFQAREFLAYAAAAPTTPPFVLDVFALDAITEMLSSPLRFLSYVSRRTTYVDRILASHELMVLAYHLRKNLWVADEEASLFLDDDVSTPLDVAMAVRREGVPGDRTPDGILTRIASSSAGKLIEQIEATPHPAPLALGFLLLMASEEALEQLSKGLDAITERANRDRKVHDFTLTLSKPESGVTIHATFEPRSDAQRRLESHCVLRKYRHKAATWVGVAIEPSDGQIRFGVLMDYPWSPDNKIEAVAKGALAGGEPSEGRIVDMKRVRRNDPCPCGSGLKFKKCHAK